MGVPVADQRHTREDSHRPSRNRVWGTAGDLLWPGVSHAANFLAAGTQASGHRAWVLGGNSLLTRCSPEIHLAIEEPPDGGVFLYRRRTNHPDHHAVRTGRLSGRRTVVDISGYV